jgi:hypothetical protein
MRFKIGSIYSVTFDDHASGREVIQCTAIGKITKTTKEHIVLRNWHVHGRDDDDENHEEFSIMKSCIHNATSYLLRAYRSKK